jgi:hypothetical protein
MSIKGGHKIASALQKIIKQHGENPTVQVGFMADAVYEDGTPVAMVAALNEYGTKKIPPRPFFRGMINENKGDWGGYAANFMKETGNDVIKTLDLMGGEIQGELKNSIRDFSDPPNAQSTIDKKGFNDPLIDSGRMYRDSVTFKIKE